MEMSQTREEADPFSFPAVLGKEYFTALASSVWVEILVDLPLEY